VPAVVAILPFAIHVSDLVVLTFGCGHYNYSGPGQKSPVFAFDDTFAAVKEVTKILVRASFEVATPSVGGSNVERVDQVLWKPRRS